MFHEEVANLAMTEFLGHPELDRAVLQRPPELARDAARKAFSGQDDPVHQPPHYSRFVIEPTTYVAANGLNFCRGNVVKYVTRAGHKGGSGDEIDDLRKAIRYLEIEIDCVQRRARVAAGENPSDVWKRIL